MPRLAPISTLLTALAIIGFAAPAASACRIGPLPIAAPVWERAPAPDQVPPGEVALEVAFPDHAHLVEPTRPDGIVVTTCNPEQLMLFQIVRVLAGDPRGAEFVIVQGSMIMTVVPVDPATGKPVEPTAPQRWFVVGALNLQTKYTVAVDDPPVTHTLLALNPRPPPQ